MATTRAKKEKLLEGYEKMFSEAQVAVFAAYQGLNAGEMTALRRQLEGAGIEFHVIKNTLARKILENRGVSTPDTLWQGPTAVGVSAQDPVAAAKVVVDYAKNEKRLIIKAGLLGNKLLSDTQVADLASLPSREVLLGQLLAGLQSPITGLVTVLGGVLRGLVNVLDARVRQLQESTS